MKEFIDHCNKLKPSADRKENEIKDVIKEHKIL